MLVSANLAPARRTKDFDVSEDNDLPNSRDSRNGLQDPRIMMVLDGSMTSSPLSPITRFYLPDGTYGGSSLACDTRTLMLFDKLDELRDTAKFALNEVAKPHFRQFFDLDYPTHTTNLAPELFENLAQAIFDVVHDTIVEYHRKCDPDISESLAATLSHLTAHVLFPNTSTVVPPSRTAQDRVAGGARRSVFSLSAHASTPPPPPPKTPVAPAVNKYGIHMVFRGLVVDSERALAMRARVLSTVMRMEASWRSESVDNADARPPFPLPTVPWTKVIDGDIYRTPSLRLPYSRKVVREPLLVPSSSSAPAAVGANTVGGIQVIPVHKAVDVDMSEPWSRQSSRRTPTRCKLVDQFYSYGFSCGPSGVYRLPQAPPVSEMCINVYAPIAEGSGIRSMDPVGRRGADVHLAEAIANNSRIPDMTEVLDGLECELSAEDARMLESRGSRCEGKVPRNMQPVPRTSAVFHEICKLMSRHPVFDYRELVVTDITRSEKAFTIEVSGPGDRRCGNLSPHPSGESRSHNTAKIYFRLIRSGMIQKCLCRCSESASRATGRPCYQYESIVPIYSESMDMLFAPNVDLHAPIYDGASGDRSTGDFNKRARIEATMQASSDLGVNLSPDEVRQLEEMTALLEAQEQEARAATARYNAQKE